MDGVLLQVDESLFASNQSDTLRRQLLGQNPHNTGVEGSFEVGVRGVAFVEVEFPFVCLAHGLANDHPQGQIAVLFVVIDSLGTVGQESHRVQISIGRVFHHPQ